jgi:stage IV sporulation protein FB
MGRIKFSIHPLFLLVGVFYAFTGKILYFLVYTISAVIHELGHSLVAGRFSCELNKITLMPFGAVVKGNIEGLSFKDQVFVALAGPIVNLVVAIFFIAIWWIKPEIYAYTDIAAEACLSIALVNFLPIFPLDGGRILTCLLCQKFGERKGEKASRVISLVFSVLLILAFIYTCFYKANISLLIFSAFLLLGAFGKSKENEYLRAFKGINSLNLKNGVAFKKIGVDKSVTVKKLISMLDFKCINEVAVFDGDEILGVLSQKRLAYIIEKGDFYAKISQFV